MIAAKGCAALAGLLGVLMLTSSALADVKYEGKWPDASKEKLVSLDVSHMPREDALKKLADAAGWSIALHDVPSGDVGTIHAKNLPAGKVLEMILGDDGDFVAKRDGDLVTIDGDSDSSSGDSSPRIHVKIDTSPGPVAAPEAPPAPPSPPAPPAPTTRGEDRTIAGGNLRIDKSEVVHDVNVFGGNVDVYGTVTGDLQVMGGNVRMHEGAHVMGDASTFGGTLSVDDGAAVDGDVSVVGGKLKRSQGCHLGGGVFTKGGDEEIDDDKGAPMAHPKMPAVPPMDAHQAKVKKLQSLAAGVGEAVTSAALLFVFGAVLLALTGKRMEMLRVEAAARPMRSFALGIVGFFASILVVIALCITIIGIPIAVVGVLLAIFAAYAGVCATLTVVGQAMLKHKTENSYVHLAVGCALFMVVSAIPVVGSIVTIIVAALGIGTIVATRVGGLVPKKRRPNEGPYRTPPVDAPVDA